MRQYIEVVAPKFNLPPDIVEAVCRVESRGDRFAMRHEACYPYLWNVVTNLPFRVGAEQAKSRIPHPEFPAPHGSTFLTEWIGQQTSWGLMQVMGAVAREYGFKGYFPGLCDPLEGLNYGCRHLAHFRDQHLASRGWAGVLDAYNDGTARIERPDDYPFRVAAALPAAAALIKG